MKVKLDKEVLSSIEKSLTRRPRTAGDLHKISKGNFFPYLDRISKGKEVLYWRIWEDGWRFVYWIKPQRLGKVWKKTYMDLRIGTNDGLVYKIRKGPVG